LSQCTRLTDGQTDGQTDRRNDRNLMARPRLHSMQRGKNRSNCGCFWMYVTIVAYQIIRKIVLLFIFYFFGGIHPNTPLVKAWMTVGELAVTW